MGAPGMKIPGAPLVFFRQGSPPVFPASPAADARFAPEKNSAHGQKEG